MCDELKIPKMQLAPNALSQNMVVYSPDCACSETDSGLGCSVVGCGKSLLISGNVGGQSLFHIKVERLRNTSSSAAIEVRLSAGMDVLALRVGADLRVSAAIGETEAVEGAAQLASVGASGVEFYAQLGDALLLYSTAACNLPFSSETAVTRSFGAQHGTYQQLAEQTTLALEFESVAFDESCTPILAVSTFEATNSVCVPKVSPQPSPSPVEQKSGMHLLMIMLVLLVMGVIGAVVLAKWRSIREQGRSG